jgi:hypothetical protein
VSTTHVRALGRVVRPLWRGALALLLGVVTFEGVLAVALPGRAAPPGAEPLSPAQAPHLLPNAASRTTADEGKQPPPTCRTEYYAVFDVAGSRSCAQNTTTVLAEWGPPPAGWLRHSGGQLVVHGPDLAPASRCLCLAQQPGYAATEAAEGLQPVGRLVLDGESHPIAKWVCADSCDAPTEAQDGS